MIIKRSGVFGLWVAVLLSICFHSYTFAQYLPTDDFDNDGILNSIDIDDDNDGILDITENPCTGVINYVSWDNQIGTTIYGTSSQNGNSIALTFSSSQNLAFQKGITFHMSQGDCYGGTAPVAMDLANNNNGAGPHTITFSQPVQNPVLLVWSLGSSGIIVDLTFSATFNSLNTTGCGTTVISPTTVRGQEGNMALEFAGTFNSISWTGSTTENYVGYNMGLRNSCPLIDYDNDGIPNQFDLDSDNDNCSDANEAGATSNTIKNYVFASSFGANGFADTLETNNNGIPNYTVTYSNAIDSLIKTCCFNFAAGPDKATCFLSSAAMSANGTGNWTALPGNPGTATVTYSDSANTAISGYSIPGIYKFEWSNGSCLDTAEVLVNALPVANAGPNKQLTCSITSVVIGTPSVNNMIYSWNPGNGLNSTTLAQPTATQSGIYTVSVTDTTNGCMATSSLTITNPSAPQLTNSSGNVNCFGDNTGWAQVNTLSTGSYTYSWSSGQTTSTISNITAGTYTATVTDANQCSSTLSITITENTAITLSVSSMDASCGISNGSATATVMGGISPYIYSWTSGSSTTTANNLAGNTYTVFITDNISCSASTTIILNQTSAVTSTISSTNASCPGKNDGTATVSALGGVSPYIYSWSASIQNTPSVSNLNPGTFTVTITDSKNCTNSITTTIGSNIAPIADAGTDQNINIGTTVQLSGSGGSTYSWTPSVGLNCTDCTDPIASPTASTDYILTVKDSLGCSDSDTIKVFIDINCGDLFIPTAFSPNGDGMNDVFMTRGKCIKELQLILFTRWGEKIFETTDPAIGWDGYFRGKLLEDAVFIFYLDASFYNGESISKKGNVTLIR